MTHGNEKSCKGGDFFLADCEIRSDEIKGKHQQAKKCGDYPHWHKDIIHGKWDKFFYEIDRIADKKQYYRKDSPEDKKRYF